MAGKITAKQKKFVDEYLVDLNATQAAARAGYKDPSFGRQLIAKPHVSAYIQIRQRARSKRTEITQDRVLQELASIGFADIADYVSVKDGCVKIKGTAEVPKEKRAAVAGIKQGANGVEVKINDKMRALELIGKHLGMFRENSSDTADTGMMEEYLKLLKSRGGKSDA